MCCFIFVWCGNNQQQESNDTIIFNELKKSFTWNIVDWTNLQFYEKNGNDIVYEFRELRMILNIVEN